MNQRGSARAWVLAFVVLAGGGLATFIGVGCLVSANACPFRAPPKQTATEGDALFLANCAACHGRDGKGRKTAPSLVSGPLAAFSGTELESKIGRGKPLAGMPRFSRTLSALQISAIARFVESLRGASPAPAVSS